MRRAAIAQKPRQADARSPKLRQSKCKACGEKYSPWSSTQTACRVECARLIASLKIAKDQAEQDKKKREAMKSIPQLKKEAQIEFNAYIRLRDSGRGCVSCGIYLRSGEVGGGYDCGHYRSVGSADHLRFDPRNAHGQCKRCNRYGAGMAHAYRLALLARFGPGWLEALECDQASVKWTREMLKVIKSEYKSKAKELAKLLDK